MSGAIKKKVILATVPAVVLLLVWLDIGRQSDRTANPDPDALAALGSTLFVDVNLSRNRTQSCASCHDPARAFTDPRVNGVAGAASLGDDGASLGDRNAPTVTYAQFNLPFQLRRDGEYEGGQFWDGRERDLEGQAGAPFLNPIEMGMPNKAAVVERLQENPAYKVSFRQLFGRAVFDQVDTAYAAMTSAIAAFERTKSFAPFDSKYDRYLRGEYQPTEDEAVGIFQFFSGLSSCNRCHMLRGRPEAPRETFSSYQYKNIGVPVNRDLREVNGLRADFTDHGLLGNPKISDNAMDGRFKIPTLRNVAVTAPYMHNGVFRDLRTVVKFYNKYNAHSNESQLNPETGEPWGEPEVAENIALEELEIGGAFDDLDLDALVAFLKMLTDSRYEHLLEE